MEFGDAVKKLRTDKNLTQKEVAFQITSRSYLSLMESNKYTPSCLMFNQLLNRLSVTYEEFLFVLNENNSPYSRRVFIELSLLANKHDLSGLKKLEVETYTLYLKENDLYLYHISLVSKALRLFYENNNTPSEEISSLLLPVKEYLLSCNCWHLYEMKLFNNCMFAFSIEDVLFFSKLALKKIEHYTSFNEFQNSKQHMLLNISTLLIAYKKYDLAIQYSTKALHEANTHLLLYEKILSKLNLNICLCCSNKNKEQAKETIEQLLDTMSLLGLEEVRENCEEILLKHNITLK